MTVKGYVVCSTDYQWAKPYLFRLEAKEIAELMTVTSGKAHWIVRIEMHDMSNALVRFNDKELITDVWNINPLGDGFEAEIVIEGCRYKVEHLSPFEPWSVVPVENAATGYSEVLEQNTLNLAPLGRDPEPAPAIRRASSPANDEAVFSDSAPVRS